MLSLVLAAALAAAPDPTAASSVSAPSEPATRWSVSLGAGHAWGFVGVRGEARFGHWGLGLAVSPIPHYVELVGGTLPDGTLTSQGYVAVELGVAAGARWYSTIRPWFEWFVGAHVDAHPLSAAFFGGVTGGVRFHGAHFFVELAAGPAAGVIHYSDRGDRLPPAWVFGFGALGPATPTGGPSWLPDVGLAAGWEF